MQQTETHEYECPKCGKRPAQVYRSRSPYFGENFLTTCCRVTALMARVVT
jgi:C4-type Zn-finger protein